MLALDDEGAWLNRIILDDTLQGKNHHFYAFVMLGVLFSNPDSLRAAKLMCNCMELILSGKEKLIHTTRGRILLNLGRYKLANAYVSRGNEADIRKAIALMQESADDMETPWEEMDAETQQYAESNPRNLLSLYRHMANFYLAIGSRESAEEALRVLQTALEKGKALQQEKDSADVRGRVAALYNMLANTYLHLEDPDLNKILSCNQSAIELLQSISREERRESANNELVSCYRQRAQLLAERKDAEAHEQAFVCANKALQLSEEMLRAGGSVEDLARLADCYNISARLFAMEGQKQDLEKASRIMEKFIALQETVCRELDTESAWSDLCEAYSHVVKLQMDMGQTENLLNAAQQCRKVIALLLDYEKRQEKKHKTVMTPALLLAEILVLGEILETLGTRESVGEAAQWYEEGIEIGNRVLCRENAEKAYPYLRSCYYCLGNLLKKLGLGSEAAEIFTKRAVLDRAQLEQKGDFQSAERLWNSLTSVCNLCMELEGEWLKVALDGYLEQITLYNSWLQQGFPLQEPEEYGVILGNTAWIYEYADDHRDMEKALEVLIQRCQIKKKCAKEAGTKEAHREFARSCIALARVSNKLGDSNRVYTFAQNAKSLWQAIVQSDSNEKNLWNLSICHRYLGQAALQLGKNDEAMDALQTCVSIRETLVEEHHLPEAKQGLVTSLRDLAEHPDVLPAKRRQLLQRALQLARELFDEDPKESYRDDILQLQKLLEETLHNE